LVYVIACAFFVPSHKQGTPKTPPVHKVCRLYGRTRHFNLWQG